MILEKFSQAIDNENYQLAQQYLHEMKAIIVCKAAFRLPINDPVGQFKFSTSLRSASILLIQ